MSTSKLWRKLDELTLRARCDACVVQHQRCQTCLAAHTRRLACAGLGHCNCAHDDHAKANSVAVAHKYSMWRLRRCGDSDKKSSHVLQRDVNSDAALAGTICCGSRDWWRSVA
jgi:hypothetical protein